MSEPVRLDGREGDEGDDVYDDKEPPSLAKLLAALALGARAVNSLPLAEKGAHNGDGDGDDDDEAGVDEDNDFAFQMAFPEYCSLCRKSQEALSRLLSLAVAHTSAAVERSLFDEVDRAEYEFEDPALWERCADACEALMERVDAYVEAAEGGQAGFCSEALQKVTTAARGKARCGHDRILNGLVDMQKPQITHHFIDTLQNSRTKPFLPPIHPQKPHSLTSHHAEPFALTPITGHGLQTSSNCGLFSSIQPIPHDVVAPPLHYPHPYHEEITNLEYTDWQLLVPSLEELGEHGRGGTLNQKRGEGAQPPPVGVWIDTEDDLRKLSERIEHGSLNGTVLELAVDLEAHSYRTFSGFVCLMQISLRRNPGITDDDTHSTIQSASDFLIDTLSLRCVLNKYMASTFANPKLVKVMHGSDHDIAWLQRDFGIYVVNLFDTGRAARMLPAVQAASLAYLLGNYANVQADKTHQLSDWRQRPLPYDMKVYATSDTYYLLDIYDRLRLDLDTHSNSEVSIRAALDISKKVSLIRYDKEPFFPSGYKSLVSMKRGKKKNSVLSIHQEVALKALFDWRDRAAREEDESLHFVCANALLMRIAVAFPKSVPALQEVAHPLPPLVLKHANEVLRLIKDSAKTTVAETTDSSVSSVTKTKPFTSSPETISQLRASASPFAFFKPAQTLGSSTSSIGPDKASAAAGGRDASGILSPVLGTEALYKQAGWISPQVPLTNSNARSSIDESVFPNNDAKEENDKGENEIAINKANKDFVSTEGTPHSLELGSRTEDGKSVVCATKRRGKTVDGMGAARIALGQDREEKGIDFSVARAGGEEGGVFDKNGASVEHESKMAQRSAERIRSALMSGKRNLLGLPRPQSNDIFVGHGAPLEQESERTENNDAEINDIDDIAEMTVPKSMKEIYQISNRNRRRSKKSIAVLPSLGDDATLNAESFEVDAINGAEALLASRGVNGTGYFGSGGTTEAQQKRQRLKSDGSMTDETGDHSSFKGAGSFDKEADIGLLVEMGWVKDKKEAESLMAQHVEQAEAADNINDGESRKNGSSDGSRGEETGRTGSSRQNSRHGEGSDGGRNGGKQKAGRRDSKRGVGGTRVVEGATTVVPFDYSTAGVIGAYDAKAPACANPFFAGAAVIGGVLVHGNNNNNTSGGNGARRKKGATGNNSNSMNTKGKKSSGAERPGRGDGSKSFVYRNDGGQR